MDLVIVLLIGLLVGSALGWLVRASRPGSTAEVGEDPALIEARHERAELEARQERTVLEARHERTVAEIRGQEAAARAEVEADLAGAVASIEGLRDQLVVAREQFTATVAQHHDEARKRQAAEQAESKVLQKLAPVATQIRDMQQKVADLEKQRSRESGELGEQIKATRRSAEQSKLAAETLSSALRNNSVRGAYGETQLESIVESVGLLKRIDYSTQESITADSGARRPDMVIKLPGRKQLAIDAKVPYRAYFDAHAADLTDEARSLLLVQHAKQVRAHVDALSKKEYWTGLQSSPEFTIAFIPNDSILNAALEADADLIEYALNKGVVVATPINLWAVLKTVAFTWRQEDLADNAQDLVDLGRELYKRLGTLSDHVSKLGRSIERTVADYNKFTGSLEGRVLATARKLDAVDEAKQLRRIEQIEETPRPLTTAEMTALELEAFDDLDRPEIEAEIVEPGLFGDDEKTG